MPFHNNAYTVFTVKQLLSYKVNIRDYIERVI